MSSAMQDPLDSIVLARIGNEMSNTLVATGTYTLIYGTYCGPCSPDIFNVDKFLSRHVHTPVLPHNCGIPVSSLLISITQPLKHLHRRKGKTSRAQHWMFIASVMSFLIATVLEGSQIASIGITIHAALTGHQGLSMLGKEALVNRQLFVPNVITEWMSSLEVRGLIKIHRKLLDSHANIIHRSS